MATGSGRARGQALVELALILPLLLLLTAGLVELGRVFLALGVVEAGAYRGATYAAFSRAHAFDATAIRAAAVSDWGFPLSSANPAVNAAVTPEGFSRTDGLSYDTVSVTVAYSYTPLLSWPGVPAIATLSRTVAMRIQP